MRKDMHEVVTLRPRSGATYNRRRVLPEDQTKVSMKKTIKFGKQFDDFLSPLIRLLQKRVGRSWNKTYSDICEGLTKNGVHRNHLKNHIRDLVVTGPAQIAMVLNKDLFYSRGQFYVKDGILREVPGKRL